MVELASGATFAFPLALVHGLCDATPDQLADIEVTNRLRPALALNSMRITACRA